MVVRLGCISHDASWLIHPMRLSATTEGCQAHLNALQLGAGTPHNPSSLPATMHAIGTMCLPVVAEQAAPLLRLPGSHTPANSQTS